MNALVIKLLPSLKQEESFETRIPHIYENNAGSLGSVLQAL